MERGEGSMSSGAAFISDEEYQNWKPLVPVLYDWFDNHHLFCPSLSCRWGPQIEQGTYKNCQRLYLSEQIQSYYSNSLVIANCEIMKPKIAAAERISLFNEQSPSLFVKKYKTLIHPGEVNRIKELPQKMNIVATHANDPDVFLWNLDTQPNRNYGIGAAESRPDVILTGHTENAEFALAMCCTEPFVLSGGHDKSVILWSIEDCGTSLASKKSGNKSSRRVMPRGIFAGHGATVEDVQFCPSSAQEFCSVGDDSCLILWDARSGNAPVIKVRKAHNADHIICVDWNVYDVNLIITGSSDHKVHMFDRRNLTARGVGSPIYMFEDHKSTVTSIEWCPDTSSVFATGAGDGILNIWDHNQVGNNNTNVRAQRKSAAPGLFFKHVGHRGPIADFHWNPNEPWTIASVSMEISPSRDSGTLQIWRMSDLLYRPEEDVIAELDQFKERLETCGSPEKFKKSKSTGASQLVNSNKSKSPVKSKKSKSRVAIQPVESKKTKSPVASPPVESKEAKSPVASPAVKSKKSKSSVASPPMESKEAKSPVASPPVKSKKSKSPVASPPVESKKSKSAVASQPVKSKKSKSTVATQPVESKKSKPKKSTG